MNIYIFGAFLAVVTGSALSAFIAYKSWDNLARRYFAIVTQVAAVWCLFPIAAALPVKEELQLLLARLTYVAASFTPTGVLHFVLAVTGDRRRHLRRSLLSIAYLGSIIFLLLAFHPGFIVGLMRYAPHFAPIPGPLFTCFIGFYVAICVTAFIVLVQNYRIADSQKKNQMMYLFIAFGIAIFSPLLHFGGYYFRTEPIPHDFLFVTYSSIIAYAIVRHQLMDIEVIVKRTLQFAGLAGSVVAVVSLVAFVSQDLLAQVVVIPKWLSNVFAAAIIAAVYGPMRNWLVNVTDRYLFQKKYDYKELLKQFTDEIVVGIKNLQQLVQLTVNRLSETVKLQSCSLLLLNKDSRKYELMASKGANPSTSLRMSPQGTGDGLHGQQLALEEQEPFITFLRETHEPIGRDGQLGKVRFPESVTQRLTQLHARLCLPLHIHEELVGVLCLGQKKSDEEFTKDDVDDLQTVAKTLAIAVANAQQADELAKTQAEAAQREKLAVIGTLSAGINHEICNPLGIVKAQCEAFLLDSEDGILIGKSQQDILERTSTIMRVALKQIDRATAITQKLSNFAKPIKEPTTQPVSVEQEVDEVLLLVGHDLKLEKIEVIKEIQPDLPPIVVDRRQLQEVLFNLARNAGQAIIPPGTIWVRGHTKDDGQVRIEIADTGIGIPPDKLGKIYDPFFTTKEPGKGTGLGLFIVRQIIERNKGRISVESEVGKGTTFFLDFPAAKAVELTARMA